MEALQLDAYRIIAQVLQSIPHAHAGMVRPILGIQNPIDRAVSGNEVVRMAPARQVVATTHFTS